MDNKGRLVAREYHGRLMEALERFRAERDRTLALAIEAYDELSSLHLEEQDKLDNMTRKSGGLEFTANGEAIQFALETLEVINEDLEALTEYLSYEDHDPAVITLEDLYKISKIS
ncbi:hypothetical protein GCM10017784_37080 [Deinococcus indicus]|uniref:hypothetical protein n=1 Tax=Deinococcus indicus TaxID=223556 RepID=UPI00174E66A1|nr:hypothetical protein [Deinococcus indicus]GHG38912.1 hypothetical protein GCM10017784_37080 [Deinococcus indicus]